MKKEKACIGLFGKCFVVSALIVLAGSSVSFAQCNDMESMMSEGIGYGCQEEAKKVVSNAQDSRLTPEALMAEGMVGDDAYLPAGTKVVAINHKTYLTEGLEACYCEGPVQQSPAPEKHFETVALVMEEGSVK